MHSINVLLKGCLYYDTCAAYMCDWLKKRQSENGMDELIMAELAADVGGFQHNFT